MSSVQGDHAGSIVIGEGVTVSGKFTVPGRAVVNGSLQGELQADELLVGVKGKLVGNVKVRKADVFGETHDTLLASEHLIIRSSGRINGKASYGEIEIERGGLIEGAINPTKSIANGNSPFAGPSGNAPPVLTEITSNKLISGKSSA